MAGVPFGLNLSSARLLDNSEFGNTLKDPSEEKQIPEDSQGRGRDALESVIGR
jgi:hypothetical protein